MATLNRLELPDELLAAIERRARERGISVEQQLIQDLAIAEGEQQSDDEEKLLADIRGSRDAMAARGIELTDEFLSAAKSWGRE